MLTYVVKSHDPDSIRSRPLPKKEAEKIRDSFNNDYQSDNYYIEVFEVERFFSGFTTT